MKVRIHLPSFRQPSFLASAAGVKKRVALNRPTPYRAISSAVACLVLLPQLATAVGLVYLAGDDADQASNHHCGVSTEECFKIYRQLLKFASASAATGGQSSPRILAIGIDNVANSTRDAYRSLNAWNAPGTANDGLNATIDYVFGAAIDELSSDQLKSYNILYIPSIGFNDAGASGGISALDLARLAGKGANIRDFVAAGGSIIALNEASGTDAWGWLPIKPTVCASNFTQINVTDDLVNEILGGQSPQTRLDHDSYHLVFTGPCGFSGLKPLAYPANAAGTCNGRPTNSYPVIIGGNVDLESGVTCEISPMRKWRVDPGTVIHFTVTAFSPNGSVASLTAEGVPGGATVGPVVPAATAVCTGLALAFDWTPGPGDVCTTTVVKFRATDTRDDETECTAEITVTGSGVVPPAVICPPNIRVTASDPNGAVVNYADRVTVAPGTDPSPGLLCTPPSGSLFPMGATVVTCTAMDHCGNTSSCTFEVDVESPARCEGIGAGMELWPPDHELVPVTLSGEAQGTVVMATGVTQDEPLDADGDGRTCPDAMIVNGVAHVRAERSGTGNGRVYTIAFTATDRAGETCTGSVEVCVPHDRRSGHVCVKDPLIVNSLGPCGGTASPEPLGDARLVVLSTTGTQAVLEYSLPSESAVLLSVYDVAGRRVAVLENSRQTSGTHTVRWDTGGVPRGMYFYRLRVGAKSLSGPVLLAR